MSGGLKLFVSAPLDGDGKDEAVIDFGLNGLWVRENNSVWTKLHSMNPELMATGNLNGS